MSRTTHQELFGTRDEVMARLKELKATLPPTTYDALRIHQTKALVGDWFYIVYTETNPA